MLQAFPVTQSYIVHSFRAHSLHFISLDALKMPRTAVAQKQHFILASDSALLSSGQRTPVNIHFAYTVMGSVRKKVAVILHGCEEPPPTFFPHPQTVGFMDLQSAILTTPKWLRYKWLH